MKRISLLLSALIIGFGATAQQVAPEVIEPNKMPSIMMDPMNYLILFVIIILFSTILVLARIVRLFAWLIGGVPVSNANPIVKDSNVKKVPFWNRLNKKLNDAVPVETEKDILLDHNYDGIRELDNNLPPWWKVGFYLTIVFAAIYMINYHVTSSGNVQLDEYNAQLAQAEVQKEERLKLSANNIDESNATLLTAEAEIKSGQKIFGEKCLVCHGKLGEGLVGPNLTDNYWLHGGSINDIFKIIKYGFPSKGMLAWQDQLTPIQIQQVASFIKSIKGTNPPNAKASQGDLFEETINSTNKDTTTVSDTSKAIAMSTQLNPELRKN